MAIDGSDEYTYSQVMTIGGAGNPSATYIADVPFAGDEYEYTLVSVVSGDVAGPYFGMISGDQDIPTIPFDGSVSFGGLQSAPRGFLKAQLIRILATQTVPPSDTWVRVTNGAKYLYFHTTTPAASSMFISVQFRFLPIKAIPGRATTVPPEAEHQHNIARSDKVLERLQIDMREGDEDTYGRRHPASTHSRTGRIQSGRNPNSGRD